MDVCDVHLLINPNVDAGGGKRHRQAKVARQSQAAAPSLCRELQRSDQDRSRLALGRGRAGLLRLGTRPTFGFPCSWSQQGLPVVPASVVVGGESFMRAWARRCFRPDISAGRQRDIERAHRLARTEGLCASCAISLNTLVRRRASARHQSSKRASETVVWNSSYRLSMERFVQQRRMSGLSIARSLRVMACYSNP